MSGYTKFFGYFFDMVNGNIFFTTLNASHIFRIKF